MTSHCIGKFLTVLLLVNVFAAKTVADDVYRAKRLGPEDLAVIVNDADPLSVKIAEYYQTKRRIPEINMVHVRFTPSAVSMPRLEFEKIKAAVDRATPARVQAYALAWTKPYRVDCMSITTALATGFDPAFCSKPCSPTKPSAYFNSNSRQPHDDHKLRPAMMLAGLDFEQVKRLVDRGVASDGTFPRGTGYLVSTSDKARNVRAGGYPEIAKSYLRSRLDLRFVQADYIEGRKNVLFYFTGVKNVEALKTIRFVPGAIADHLTSAGGDLLGNSGQMSSLRWTEAGATASYGAVTEPCNYPQKFPHPGVVINRYLAGETLIEAYWKSVAWPGEGVFIGEPLAAPFAARHILSPENPIQ